jgi:hypothetical protein
MNQHPMRRNVWRIVKGLMKRVRRALRSFTLVRRIVRPLSQGRVRRTAMDVLARRTPWYADERTLRKTAEAERGGFSSQESAARFARREHRAGTHQKAAMREEGPTHQRPEQEEPQARIERTPGGEKHMPDVRRG